MLPLCIEVAGETAIHRGIARISEGLDDCRPVWPAIEDDFYALEKAQFASQGAEGGSPWAPLALSTAKWRAVRFPGNPILVRTGDLEKSLTDPHDPNAVCVEGRGELTLGSRLPYGLYHQTGTRRMPARPLIQFSEAFRSAVMRHIQTYLARLASESGLQSEEAPDDGR